MVQEQLRKRTLREEDNLTRSCTNRLQNQKPKVKVKKSRTVKKTTLAIADHWSMQRKGISLRRRGGANDQKSKENVAQDLPSQTHSPQNGRLKGKLVIKIHKDCVYLRGTDQ